jgi:hypothetical protein
LNVRNYDGVNPVRIALSCGFASQLPEPLRPKPPGVFTRALAKLGFARAAW